MEIVIERYQMEDFINILLLNGYKAIVQPTSVEGKIKITIEKE